MTVSSGVKKSGPYSGDGSTTVFTVGFPFQVNGDVLVTLTDANGLEVTQTETTHYTLAGAGGAGGTVTMLTAPAVGETLVINRNVDLTQEADYVENDDFPAETHEGALDKATMIDQQIQEQVDRALRVPISSELSGSDLELPTPAGGSVIGWNSAGDGLENVTPTTVTPGDIALLTDYSDNLETAISTISTTPKTLFINTTPDALTANATIPATLSIIWLQGCILPLAGFDFTVNGSVLAGAYQLVSGGGTTTYSGGGVSFGEWDDSGDIIEIDGVALTATVAELNILDGVTADKDELNILDGVLASAAELNKAADGLVDPPLAGDATAGRVLRTIELIIQDGTDADTINCTVNGTPGDYGWNGDSIVETDNIGKSATVGNFTLSASGGVLTIEAAGLSGNVVGVVACSITENETATAILVRGRPFANDIQLLFSEATGGAAADLTSVLSGSNNVYVLVTYLTDA